MVSATATTRRIEFFPEAWVAQGYFDTLDNVFKFGFNDAVGTAEETIWDEGGVYVYPSSAEQLTVSSSDVNDTSAGTGARTVQVFGLDGDYAEVDEIVTLNGQTAVTTVNSYLRVFRMAVLTAGSGGINAGVIYCGTGTVTGGVPDTVYARITEGEGQTLMAVYTVPAGKTGLLYVFNISSFSSGNSFVTARLKIRNEGGVFRVQDKAILKENSITISRKFPAFISEKTDIEITGVASSGTIDVSGSFEMMLAQKLP